jgi:hypothetical protein
MSGSPGARSGLGLKLELELNQDVDMML